MLLTLKAPIILRKCLDISCEFWQTIHMKFQDLFSKKNFFFRMSSIANLLGALRVK